MKQRLENLRRSIKYALLFGVIVIGLGLLAARMASPWLAFFVMVVGIVGFLTHHLILLAWLPDEYEIELEELFPLNQQNRVNHGS